MDRYNLNSQLEHLQAKYVGTGHADTTKHEWLVNQHRDTIASYIGHHNLISYFAIAENESIERMRFKQLKKMMSPCGPVPE